MKRVGILGAALVCCIGLVLICGLSPIAKASNDEAHFIDVPANAWYYDSAYFCYDTGIFVGDHAGRFQPDRFITAQESYAILARLHQVHTGNAQSFSVAPGESWSDPYLRYCVEHKIASNQDAAKPGPFTREDLVRGLSRIYDVGDLQKINNVTSLADYSESTDLGQFVLMLYQAGVLNGTDAYGSFSPTRELSRAECATILTRLMDPQQCLRFDPAPPLTMELAFLTASDTVYAFDGAYIYLIDSLGETPIYRVVDLYGRTVLQSKDQIGRQESGIFKVNHQDADTTSYYNDQGSLVFSWPKPLDSLSIFSHGKLAVKQDDNSILVVDAQGNNLGTVEAMDNYRVVGSAFSDYIPVVPESGRKNDYSYWLDFHAGTIEELPYGVEWSATDIGHSYMIVKRYDEAAGRWFYNAVDTSLNLVFPKMMESATVLTNGLLLAEDDTAYYTIKPGVDMEIYLKSQWGTIQQFSPSGRILTQEGQGETKVKNLETGETFFFAPDTNAYLVAGRKILHYRNISGETLIDLLDGRGMLEQEGISAKDIWHGDSGQILYRIADQYLYISA